MNTLIGTDSTHRLLSHCELVCGASGRGAIYDLNTGNVFSVNQKAVQIIRGETPDDQGYWRKLETSGLAEAISTSNQGSEPSLSRACPKENYPLEFIWCEITSACNENCLHCYGSFGKPRPHNVVVDWNDILRQAAMLGCKRVQFIGGEPLLVKNLLFDLIALARQLGYSFIEVFTNGTLITHEIARYFADHGVRAGVSLYSNQPDVHDAITQHKGSFRKTTTGLHLLKEAGVPTRAAIIAMAQNQDTLETTMAYIQSCGAHCRKPDVIRPMGRGDNDHLSPRQEIVARYGAKSHPNFSTSRKRFSEAQCWNPCWKGKVAITATGNILPCVFARNTIIGNVNQLSLASVVHEAILPYWRINLDQVAECQVCEYRYACYDCRPLSHSTTGDMFGKNPRCSYDPYTGEWKGSRADG